MASVGLLVVLGGSLACEQKISTAEAQTAKPPKRLAVLTPHRENIREAFATGFWNWHLEHHGAPVEITWIYRGTPQCVEFVRSNVEMRVAGVRYEPADVMFGGGIPDHGQLAAENLSLPIELTEARAGIPDDVHGMPTRDEQGRWCATGLSSFGILYNEQACAAHGVAPPTTWEDLGDPRFFGWIAVADPATSSSHRECMVLILQHKGWAKGWQTILRVLANSRALDMRSGDALRQVQSGTALATFAVNFDGMALAAESDGALKYVDPPGATAVSLDLISVLSSASDVELAKDFVRYVLSEEGQMLWGVVRENRVPYGETLYHYPIAPAVYEQHADHLAVHRNPLKEEFGLRTDPNVAMCYGRLLGPLVRAACHAANHAQLQNAWRAAIDAGIPAAVLAELTAPPLDEQMAPEVAAKCDQADPDQVQALLDEWSAAFAQRYAKAQELMTP